MQFGLRTIRREGPPVEITGIIGTVGMIARGQILRPFLTVLTVSSNQKLPLGKNCPPNINAESIGVDFGGHLVRLHQSPEHFASKGDDPRPRPRSAALKSALASADHSDHSRGVENAEDRRRLSRIVTGESTVDRRRREVVVVVVPSRHSRPSVSAAGPGGRGRGLEWEENGSLAGTDWKEGKGPKGEKGDSEIWTGWDSNSTPFRTRA